MRCPLACIADVWVSYTHLSRSQHRAPHITQARATQARYTCVPSPRVTFRCMFPCRRRLLRALVCSSHSLSLKRKKECSQSNKAPFQMTNSCLFFLLNIYIYSPTCLHWSSFSYSGALFWNSLPPDIRNIKSIGQFKKEINRLQCISVIGFPLGNFVNQWKGWIFIKYFNHKIVTICWRFYRV